MWLWLPFHPKSIRATILQTNHLRRNSFGILSNTNAWEEKGSSSERGKRWLWHSSLHDFVIKTLVSVSPGEAYRRKYISIVLVNEPWMSHIAIRIHTVCVQQTGVFYFLSNAELELNVGLAAHRAVGVIFYKRLVQYTLVLPQPWDCG